MKLTEQESLLIRLDRVGVHQSVAARYCKEAAAEIRRLESLLRREDICPECGVNEASRFCKCEVDR